MGRNILLVSLLLLGFSKPILAASERIVWSDLVYSRTYASNLISKNTNYRLSNIVIEKDASGKGNDKFQNLITAYNKADGRTRWQMVVGTFTKSSKATVSPGECSYLGVSVQDRYLILICKNETGSQNLVARSVDPASGEVFTETQLPIKNYDSRLTNAGTIAENGVTVIGGADASYGNDLSIVAFNYYSGDIYWKNKVTRIPDRVDILGETVLTQTNVSWQNYHYQTYDVRSGTLLQKVEGQKNLLINPMEMEGQIIGQQFISGKYSLMAFNNENLSLLWKSADECTSEMIYPLTIEQTLYLVCDLSTRFRVSNFNVSRGSRNWSQEFKDETSSSMYNFSHEGTMVVNGELWIEIYDSVAKKRLLFKFDLDSGKALGSQVI